MNDTLENGTNSLPDISAVGIIAPTAVNSISLILGLPTNSYVLWLILSGGGGTIASEFFYLNLIVSVIISLLASVLFFLHHTAMSVAIVLFFFSVPSFQCCICVERYIAVVHPVVFLRYKALRYRVACCCAVWLMVFAISSAYFWAGPALGYLLVGFDIVCIPSVSFCCFSVLRALKQPGPGEGQRDSGQGNNMKRRAFKIILNSLIIMVLTTLCYFIHLLSQLIYLGPVVSYITYVMATMSGFVHPLLYIHKVGKLPCFKML